MILKQCISVIVSISLLTNQMLFAASLDLDKSATQKTSLDAAANGVPIVNITTPNAQGLSHNKFTNYNVDSKGLILNNANNVVQTQLGGYIDSNPNLSGGQSAKTILNEVTGTNRSLLNGFTEVAGNQADIIVANPNGISINGGGFINAPKVTLTTGTPTLLNAQVSSYDVSGGDILIEGEGFNALSNNQVDLYAKVVTLNAKLHAQNLKIITGENQIATDGTITSKQKAGTGVSLDSSALGGMYANTITLIGTDKGVGVNLPPEILTTNGDITISADGKISLQKATASGNIKATSTSSDIEINGAMSAASNINLMANGNIKNTDVVTAGLLNDGTHNANALFSIHSSTLENTGQLNSYGNLSLDTSASILNSGIMYAANTAHLTTAALQNSGTLFSETALALHVNDLLYNSGTIRGQNALNIETATLKNLSKINTDETLTINAHSIDNTGYINAKVATITADDISNSGTLFSTQTLSLSANNTFTNHGIIDSENNLLLQSNGMMSNDNIIAAGLRADNTLNPSASLSMMAHSLMNEGSLVSYGTLLINAGTLTNQKDIYTATYFMATLNDLINHGTLQSDDALKLLIVNNVNNSGSINAVKSIIMEAGGSITNTASITAGFLTNGTYNADASLSIKANSLTNQSSIDSRGSLNIETTTLTNSANGYINANNDLHVNANQLSNAGTIFSNQHLTLTLESDSINSGSINGAMSVDLTLNGGFTNNGIFMSGLNHDGTYNTDASITIQASSFINNGKISSQNDLYLTTPLFTNYNYVYTADLLQILANTTNNKGTLFSNNDLTLSSTNAITNDGLINGANHVTLTTNGTFANNGTLSAGLYKDGTFNANANLFIQALSFTNNQLNSQGDLSIQTSAFENKSYARASHTFLLQADTLTNAGILYSNAYLTLTLTNSLTNTGTISGGNTLDITAHTQITNNNTLIAGLYDNGTFNTNATLTLQAPSIINSATITSYGSADIQTSALSNLGSFNTKNDLTITTDTLTNTGTLFSDHDVALLINSAFANDGTINGANQLDIRTNGALINNGILLAGLYANGAINENATLSILHSSSITNNAKINSYGSTSLATAIFSNYNYLYSKALGVTTNSLTNTGTLLSDSILTLSINSDFTNEGTINSAKTLDLNINGTLTNNGTLSAGLYKDGTSNPNANLTIQTSSITNTSKVYSLGDMTITAPNSISNQGYFSALNGLHVNTATLNNYGVLFSGADMNLWVSDLLYNYENANILALGNITMAKDATLAKTKHIVNDKATIETINGDINIYAETFENITDGFSKGVRTVFSGDPYSAYDVIVQQAMDELMAEGKYETFYGVGIGATNVNVEVDGIIRYQPSGFTYSGYSSELMRIIASYENTYQVADDYGLYYWVDNSTVDFHYFNANDLNAKIIAKANSIGMTEQAHVEGQVRKYFYYPTPARQSGETDRHITVTAQQEYAISEASTPAKLLSGGKLSINADTITNYLGQISSNGDMSLIGNTLNNQSETLFTVVTSTGEYKYCYRQCNSMFHSPDYTWAPLPSSTTYTQTDAIYSTIYSAKSITGNLATVNNIDIKSDQAPLGHSATTNVTPTVSIAPVNVDVAVPQTNATLTPMNAIAADTTNVSVSTAQPTSTIKSTIKPIIDPKTHDVSITLPTNPNGLFVKSTSPTSKYLVETNPAFAVLGNFLGSDYMLSRLGVNPDATTKRLGDNFYENQLVRDSVFEQTGKRYLNTNITSDTAQYQYLMDNALAEKEALNLTPYVRLSADQVASLTKDIVWMEKHEVDGQQVLVPVVYITNAALAKTTDNGAKIIANGDINLNSTTITNQGDISSGGNTTLTASGNIYNEGGNIHADNALVLQANGGIYNISSNLSAQIISITANSFQSDIDAQTITKTYTGIGAQTSQLLSDISTINALNAISIQTTNNLSLIGTTVNAGGALNLASKEGDIAISSKTHTDTYDFTTKASGYDRGTTVHEVGSSITADSIALSSTNLLVNASDVTATNDMNIKADNIAITSGEDRVYTDSKYVVKGGFMGGGKKTADTVDKKEVISSTLSAKDLNIDSKTLSIQGSKLTAEQATIASEVIELISLKNSDYESHFSDTSGMMTRTIASKGHIKEEVVSAMIQVQNQLVINNKDVTSQLQTDNILKTITSQSGLTVEQIKLVEAYAKSEEWNRKTTSLTGMGTLIVAAVVTVCTMGAGEYLVGLKAAEAAAATAAAAATEAGTAAAAAAAASAASAATTATIQAAVVQSIVTQVANALVTAAITGNNPNIDMASLVKGAVLAGVLTYTSPYTNLTNYGFKEGVYTTKMAQAVVNASVKTAITGNSFKENLVNEVGSVAFNAVGHDLYNNSEYKDILPPKTIVQGLVGGALAELQGGDFTAGAISTATSHVVAEYMLDFVKENLDPNNPPFDINDPASVQKYSEQLKTQIKAVSSLVGGTVALATNKDLSQKDLDIAQSLSDNVQENNVFFIAALVPELISAMTAAMVATGVLYVTKDARNDSLERITNSNDNIIYAKGDKMLSPGEIEILKRNGIDPEELKGGKNTGNRDLYKDKQGNIVIKPKGGKSVDGEETGINLNDLEW